MQNEAISLVAMRSKELWFVQENHATVTLESSGRLSENGIKNLGPDYMSRAGPVSRAGLVRADPVVM